VTGIISEPLAPAAEPRSRPGDWRELDDLEAADGDFAEAITRAEFSEFGAYDGPRCVLARIS
jgi:hypothetical protein